MHPLIGYGLFILIISGSAGVVVTTRRMQVLYPARESDIAIWVCLTGCAIGILLVVAGAVLRKVGAL